MKREVERKQKLPAYAITVSQLGVLIARLTDLFQEQDKGSVNITIRVSLKDENLSFDSIDELLAYPDLRGRVTDFSVWVSQYSSSRQVRISSGSLLFDTRSTVYAEAEAEAWCAGAIETVRAFLQPHKVWYHWFVVAPRGWILFFLGNGPTIALQFMPKGTVIDKAVIFAWFSVVITLFVLWIWKGRLLPASVLRVTEEDSFLRRHASELSLLIALISAVLTVVGWFVGKSA